MHHVNERRRNMTRSKHRYVQVISAIVLGVLLTLTTNDSRSAVEAQTGQPFSTVNFRSAFAYEQLTFSTVSLGFTAATYAPTVTDQPAAFSHADYAEMSCTDNAQAAPNNLMRYRLDNVAPTAGVGTTIGPNLTGGTGGILIIWGFANISHFHGIRLGTTDVVCGIHYFKQSVNIP